MDITVAMDRDTTRDHQTALTAGGTLVGVGKAVAREGLLPLPPSPHSRGPTESLRRFVSRFAVRASVWRSSRVEFQRALLGVAGTSTRRTHGVRTYSYVGGASYRRKKKCAAPLPLLSSAPFFTERTRRGNSASCSPRKWKSWRRRKIFGRKKQLASEFLVERVRTLSRNSLESHWRTNSSNGEFFARQFYER